MKKYHLRTYFKTISIIGGLFAGIAALLNFITGDPIAFLMLVVCILSIFQYRWATNPYIEINGTALTARLTMVITKNINLKDIVKIETPKNKRIILYPKTGKKLTLSLAYLTEEDQAKLLLDIPAIVAGHQGGDLSVHLVEED